MLNKAIVLLSGGLDSATTLAMAQQQGYSCYALSFHYGQKHHAETAAAQRVAQQFKVREHRIVTLDIDQFGGSALTDEALQVPDYEARQEIPVTYVPARNTIFLSIALGWAEVLGAYDIFYGANVVDYSGYPDCRPEFNEAFERVANLATKAGVHGERFRIHAPLLHLTKAETIQLGTQLGVNYAATVSCYRANEAGEACGTCDSCHYRQQGFKEANLPDPTLYMV